MEEKILIKSEMNAKTKNLMLIITYALAALFAITNVIYLIVSPLNYIHFKGYEVRHKNGYYAMVDGETGYLIFFILVCLGLLISIISLITYLLLRKCELTITDKNARGKTIFGKEVVLPLYMISTYSTRKFLSTIAIATSSGVTKFSLIKNHAEIASVLAAKINERQESTLTETKPTVAQCDASEELVKLKSLLDTGIITQEEFDAKKKQLLGL